MSCAEFIARLQMLLDQHRDPQGDSTLRGHVSHCDECRERLESQEQLLMVLAAAATPFHETELAGQESLESVIRQALAANEPPRGWRRFALISLATCAALLGLIFWSWPAPDTSPVALTAPAAASPTTPDPAPVAPRPQPVNVAHDADQRRHGESAGDDPDSPELRWYTSAFAVSVFPNLTDRWSWGTLDLPIEATRISHYYHTLCTAPPLPNQSFPQVDQLADEILPLTQPFVSVLNILRRTLPGLGAPPLPRGEGEAAIGGDRDRFA